MKLVPYPEYKETGLPWLGRVPVHWDVRRNGRLFSQRNETGFGDLPILEVSLKTGVRVRNMDNLKRKQIMSDREKYKRAAKGDIAYNMMRMWQGAVGVVPEDGLVSPAYVVARAHPETEPRYFNYLFRTDAFKNEIDGYSRGIVKDRNRLYWEDFKRIPACFPSPEEQAAIANYLDAISSKINCFIRNRRRLIEVLNEQKQAIINRAVTRGLDPDVSLKPSGIEWLGEIPEHWEVLRLKYIARIRNGQDYKDVATDSGYPVIGSGGHFAFASAFLYEGESVLFGRKGTINKPLYINGRFWTVDTMFYTEVSKLVFAKFLHFSALSFPFDYYSTKTALPSMTQQDLGNHPVALPPADEQKLIISFIEEEIKPIVHAINRTQHEIDLIREYRTRLIADVVTGQVDVRHLAPSAPLPADDALDEDLEADALLDDDDTESDPDLEDEADAE